MSNIKSTVNCKRKQFKMNEVLKCSESTESPQCQYYVVRKKRLCRMTVRPGRQYCGEHEPRPETADGKDDKRIPCPNDPKHTCYASRLEKHLSICNARQQEQPDYIIPNINDVLDSEDSNRLPLNKIPLETIAKVVEKVNTLYDRFLKDKVPMLPEQPIHPSVMEDFSEPGRTESSLRHLRQASRLLQIVESEGLVQPDTCYVELGAGKGQLSYYAWGAWCRDGASDVLLVDRASLRHKRDNKLRDAAAGRALRLRADLAHLALERVPAARARAALVGYAKHLCGVATDYALRCLLRAGARLAGAALATCCHHRARRAACLAAQPLRELGIDAEEFDVLLGVVSWATCGDGRARGRRAGAGERGERGEAGRRAKLLLDWGRVLSLRAAGLDARLVRYVPAAVSPENVCIVVGRRASCSLAEGRK